MSSKYLLAVMLLLSVTGCVSTKNVPMADNHLENMKGSQISLAKRELPGFGAMTAGKAMFGAIGGMAMISAGNQIVAENNVEDPAIYIAQSLAGDLVGFGLTVSDENVAVSANSTSKVVKTPFNADYLLDIQTVNWSFGYFPTDWDNYRVIYSAKLRLINGKTKRVEAEGFCSRVPDQDENSPSYDELLANNAERLKQELKVAADYCIGEFKTNVLKI